MRDFLPVVKNMLKECKHAITFFNSEAFEFETKVTKSVYAKGLNDGITIGYNCAASHLASVIKQFEMFENYQNDGDLEIDLHTRRACKEFNCTPDKVTPEMRKLLRD